MSIVKTEFVFLFSVLFSLEEGGGNQLFCKFEKTKKQTERYCHDRATFCSDQVNFPPTTRTNMTNTYRHPKKRPNPNEIIYSTYTRDYKQNLFLRMYGVDAVGHLGHLGHLG